ncbi:hypothetical protein [Paenibacillus sp. P32E]|uniref:hypothetical protein n=1 Tax=Paenibacillus sp. P32E TaxID=1349434 RepID=UPI00093C2E8A|nr:hypothetical protein [Paenibacillus sp. P32E]OKP94784.1 hypothetical protein A3848_02085 [Paenibacillus sp. P32E]
MKKKRYPEFAALMKNCFDRGCSVEQLQDFIDRTRRQHMDNPAMIQIIDDLEVRYITSMNLPEGEKTV